MERNIVHFRVLNQRVINHIMDFKFCVTMEIFKKVLIIIFLTFYTNIIHKFIN